MSCTRGCFQKLEEVESTNIILRLHLFQVVSGWLNFVSFLVCLHTVSTFFLHPFPLIASMSSYFFSFIFLLFFWDNQASLLPSALLAFPSTHLNCFLFTFLQLLVNYATSTSTDIQILCSSTILAFEGELGAMRRLLHCDLNVTCSSHRNCLFTIQVWGSIHWPLLDSALVGARLPFRSSMSDLYVLLHLPFFLEPLLLPYTK